MSRLSLKAPAYALRPWLAILSLVSVQAGRELQAGEVQGPVSGVWKASEGPYRVVGDISVPAGQTLRLLPGVVVEFAENHNFAVYGRLIVQGKADSQVVFRAAAGSQASWGSIRFDSPRDSSSLHYAVIERAMTGISVRASRLSLQHVTFRQNVNGLDCVEGSRVWIGASRFEDNTNTALRASETYLYLRHCIFRGNSTGGIESAVILVNCPEAAIVQCEFFDNPTAAVEVQEGGRILLAHNTAAYNGYGFIVAYNDSSHITGNALCYNRVGLALEMTTPRIEYNDVWGNTEANYLAPPPGVGEPVATNANGTPCDAFGNISVDPAFVAPTARDFRLFAYSPLVDAGDPSNPASVWYAGAGPDIGAQELGSVVPVELVSFRWSGDHLEWQTESEANNWGFRVERSSDALTWETIGFVPGQGTTDRPHLYTFSDPNPTGSVLYYRLVQMDFSGGCRVYGPLRVETQLPPVPVLCVYPNPANPSATVLVRLFASPQEPGPGTIEILDPRGRRVYCWEISGKSAKPLLLRWLGQDEKGRALPSGVYTVVLRLAGHQEVRKLTLLR
ncbi:MAG: right-handed parallel beta-helix repeat-containing protein [candidate division KSB1 bacterium]|nr:right-handed parallel beta-helix repeat-containing protein [candidate division KSB1 bacterium]